MRLHLVTVPGHSRTYCATGGDATALRMKMWENGGHSLVVKKSDITIEQIDVPTDKAGLIAYLNGG